MSTKAQLIGLTGGIGAGKTTIAKIFIALGVPVYDSDSRAKDLMVSSEKLVNDIKAKFGHEAYVGNTLNREFLANKVFSNPKLLQKLNELVHPAVGQDFARWVKLQSSAYLIKEAALLFESGSYKQLDKVILVYCDEKSRIERVKKRDKFRSTSMIRDIIKNQMSDSSKEKLSDFVVNNQNDSHVLDQVIHIHVQLMGMVEEIA